jgi:hypothetical protein
MKPLETPRVRITSVLSCPNAACARTIYTPTLRIGEAWMKCNVAEKQRRGACPAHWFNLTLSSGSRGKHLALLIGRGYALAILATIAKPPWSVPADTVLELPLASEPGRPVHIQIACRARDEHHLRYAPIAEVLKTLQIVAAMESSTIPHR